MTAQYQLRLYNTFGSQVAVFDDWNSVYYYPRVNDFGYHTISLDGRDPRTALFTFDSMIEVWRRDLSAGIPWYADYSGFHRTTQNQITDKGDWLFTSYGRGYEDLLHRRAVLWPAGSAGDTKSGPLDDVIKAYVNENAGPAALAASGRARDGVVLGLSIGTAIGVAPMWSGSQAFKNLLGVIQDMVKAERLDFSVRRTGAATFVFDTFYPRRGADRTGGGVATPVIFSMDFGNMSTPYVVESRADEANVVIVLGPGTDANRQFVIRTDPLSVGLSPWNEAEKTFDARNTSDTLGLQTAGDQQLQDAKPTRTISFVGLDTDAVKYGRDYFLGDLVTTNFGGFVSPKKLVGLEITVASGREDFRPHFDDEVS